MTHIYRTFALAAAAALLYIPAAAAQQTPKPAQATLKIWYPSAFGSYVSFAIENEVVIGSKPANTAKPLAIIGDIAQTGDLVVFGRVGIGTGTPQAVFDVTSTDSGIILPRMSNAEAAAVIAKYGKTNATGSLIYNKNPCPGCNSRVQYYNGADWKSISLGVGAEMQIYGGSCPSGWTAKDGAGAAASGPASVYGDSKTVYYASCSHGYQCSNHKCSMHQGSRSVSGGTAAQTCYTLSGDYLVMYVYGGGSCPKDWASAGLGYVNGYQYYSYPSSSHITGVDAFGTPLTFQPQVRTCYYKQ